VDYGFRLPSALDNRPLKFKEFERYINQAIYMSATPAEWEINQAQRCLKEVPKIKGYPTNGVVELLVRPTGLLDPIVEVRPTKGQIKDLIEEIKKRVRKKQRVLVTTMTKKMAEDLTEYLNNRGIKVQYLHSDVETIERTEILLNLREGKYDVVVGINLLREGLDLPEVSLVAILDADKEGFLRSDTSLIQIMGRAARHVEGKVIMYADEITESMQRALDEAKRRRRIQEKYNKIHNIVPKSIKKEIKSQLERSYEKEREKRIKVSRDVEIENGILFVKERPIEFGSLDRSTLRRLIHVLEDKMEIAAKNLEFEKAAVIRDKIYALKRSL
jgi:excinuclease ABC subunit B